MRASCFSFSLFSLSIRSATVMFSLDSSIQPLMLINRDPEMLLSRLEDSIVIFVLMKNEINVCSITFCLTLKHQQNYTSGMSSSFADPCRYVHLLIVELVLDITTLRIQVKV